MNTSRLSPKLLVGIIIALFFSVALYLRVYLPYDQVFTGDWIKFTSVDAYYHMRIVDNLVHNFPQTMSFDPYLLYPGGMWIASPPFFDWLLAGIIWLIGLGSPTQHTIDVVGVYFPAILGALIVIPVYFIGKELFNRWAGMIAAGLIAMMPGEFLGRSILGFTDHHIAETLFATVTILFLILAIKAAKQRQLTFDHFKRREWAVSIKPLVYSLLTGISLGIYLLTWTGALLFVFIITAYFIIQFIIDHLKRKPTDYLCFIGVIPFFVALIIYLPVSREGLHLASLIIALLVPLVLSGVSQLLAGKKIKSVYYPLTLVGLVLTGGAILYIIDPNLLSLMLSQFRFFQPTEVQQTTMEMQPLFFPGGNFTLHLAWGNFTTGFFLSILFLIILTIYLIYITVKQERTLNSLLVLVVWSGVILAATLGMRRFAYYFAVNVAILTAYSSVLIYYVIRFTIDYLTDKSTDYMSWRILECPDFKELIAQPVELPTRVERKKDRLQKGRKARFRPTTTYISISLWLIVVFFLAFFWNIKPVVATAEQARFAPSDAWYSSLSWLKENSPDPFGDPDSYYELYEPPPPEEDYRYPESAYSVMVWWDYGYWITRIAHRMPNSNPGGHGRTSTAEFFLSQDEDSANEKIRALGSSYIIIDYETTTSKFWAIIIYAGKVQAEFIGRYYLPQQRKVVLLFHPEYYRSLSTRLYNFNTEAVTPQSSLVISYKERMTPEGVRYKEITSAKQFTSYEEAEAYILSQESANYEIVGTNPFISPVPLEALKHYRLIHSSESCIMAPGVGMVPLVKIFEYVK